MFGYAQSLIVNQGVAQGLGRGVMNEAERQRRRGTGAIPEERDRTQSRGLVLVVGLLLAAEAAAMLRGAVGASREFPVHVALVLGISVTFAVLVRLLRAATVGGAWSGGAVCLLLTYGSGWMSEPVWRSGLVPLAGLFALTFLGTRAGRVRKAEAGLAEARQGRNAAQVLANLSAAALCVSPALGWWLRRHGPAGGGLGFADLWVGVAMKTAALAALAEATADTVSSEVGQAFGGRPVLVTAMRRVEPGTDGAVSLVGTLSGVLGGAVVAAMGCWAMHLGVYGAVVATGCGVVGFAADTVLGATVERRGWMGNDLVNFLSTLVAAVAAMAMMRS